LCVKRCGMTGKVGGQKGSLCGNLSKETKPDSLPEEKGGRTTSAAKKREAPKGDNCLGAKVGDTGG